MDELTKYEIAISDYALRDLDSIYNYIANTLLEPGIALKLINEIEAGILSLDVMPQRCSERKTGAYANHGYRQLFVKNYTVIFRIDDRKSRVVIITVRYSARQY